MPYASGCADVSHPETHATGGNAASVAEGKSHAQDRDLAGYRRGW
jgi:hypothetical protein